MLKLQIKKNSIIIQCSISIVLVSIIALICFFFQKHIDYRITALILLMTVSVTAMLLDIIPVLVVACLSGLLLNFFFIRPILTFHITNTEDILLFFMYLVIALVSAVLTHKIREAESRARDKEEKEKTIRLYNTLLNSLSHELRTPIATIIGAIDTLSENKDKLSESSQNTLLEEIEKASVRLNRQVENLLNMSRLETGTLKINRDWCDLNELIHKVIEKITVVKDEHLIDFIPNEQLPLFKLDTGLIEEIIQNLVLNSIQYTPKKSVIRIEVIHKSDSCIISISDTGKGFPEDEMAFVFDKFYRLPNAKAGGSGLGLSIVKGFVEAHGGSIALKNTPNSGACFTIAIPSEISYLSYLKNE